jgi:DNA-binding NtrC family response regulator
MEAQRVTRVFGTQVESDGTEPTLIAHRLRLRVTSGPHHGAECSVAGRSLSIGAAVENDLALDADALVSARHCEIVVRGSDYMLRDLSSTNGTFIDGTRVLEAVLAPGSLITIGGTEIVFEPKKKWVRVQASERESFGAMVGRSKAMREVFGLLERVAATDLSCVLLGETGTGKELAARAIHAASPRAAGPFVVVDCGAVSESLVESELFGHERGAFTGADRARKGAFELAHGGTVFLDEIGELPIALQPKLLRALEQREVKCLGGASYTPIDVRVIAATHRSLEAMVDSGLFRSDLYFRLVEVVVELPPLRDRPEDVELLAEHLAKQESKNGRNVQLSADARRVLTEHTWPGNTRELRNIVRRAVALAQGQVVEASDLALERGKRASSRAQDLDRTYLDLPIREARERWIDALEREYLRGLLERFEQDVRKAADAAGLHEKSFRRLLGKHQLKR